MRKKIIYFIFIFGIVYTSFSQEKPDFVKKLENTAIKHFNLGDYILAVRNFQKLYEVDSSSLFYISQLAYSYINSERKIKEAIRLLKKYKDEGGKLDNDYFYHLGKAYMYDVKIEKALKAFKQYKFVESADKKVDKKEYLRSWEVKRLIEMCYNANKLLSRPVRVKFENLGPNINSSHDDYLPFLINGGKTLLFTSNKYFDSFYEIYTENIYQSDKNGNKWTFAKPMKKLNSEDNEELVSISYDGKRMFVRNNFYEDFSTLLVAIRKGKTFKYPLENHIQQAIDPKLYYMGGSYDVNSKTLYVAYGEKYTDQYDIYGIKELPNGTWGQPKKLPSTINTPYNEAYPVISITGDTLYFASKGHNSMGGYDIFYSVKKDGKWQKAVNLGYPINTAFDNYSIVYTHNKKYAYIAANRMDGYGGKDIYRLNFVEKEEPLCLIIGYIFLKKGDSKIEFDNHPDDFSVIVKNMAGDVIAKYKVQDKKNKFIGILPPGKYYLVFSYEGYKEKKVYLKITEDDKQLKKEITVEQL